MEKRISATQAVRDFSEVLNTIKFKGLHYIIERGGKPVASMRPIGEEKMIEGLSRVVEADFYSSCTRKPSVYRGNPFVVEAALAYGCKGFI